MFLCAHYLLVTDNLALCSRVSRYFCYNCSTTVPFSALDTGSGTHGRIANHLSYTTLGAIVDLCCPLPAAKRKKHYVKVPALDLTHDDSIFD